MPLTKQGNFSFDHSNQQDDLYKVMTAVEIKQAFDSRGNELKTTLNDLIDSLQSVVNGESGAKSIGATSVTGLIGNDVQSLIESLKTLSDTLQLQITSNDDDISTLNTVKANIADVYEKIDVLSKVELQSDIDGDSGADKIKATPISTSPDTVQGILEWLKSQIDSMVLGQIPDGSITEQKLNFDPATQAELDEHKVEDASLTTKGHVQLNSATDSTDETTAATPKSVKAAMDAATNALNNKPVDYGRYQADFGWDGTTFSQSVVTGNQLSIAEQGIVASRPQDTSSFSATAKEGMVIKMKKDSTGLNVTTSSRIIGVTKAYLYDQAGTTLIAQKDITGISAGGTFQINATLTNGTTYQILLDNGGANYTDGRFGGLTYPITSDEIDFTAGMTGGSSNTTIAFNIISVSAVTQYLSGTAIKTVTPSDLRKWGNVKFYKITPINTTLACDILSSTDVVLKSNVQSLQDISDLDISSNQVIKLKFSLSRSSISDASPTVSNPSVTWEGELPNNPIETIGTITISTAVPSIDFILPTDRHYNEFEILVLNLKSASASYLTLRLNGDVTSIYDNIITRFSTSAVLGSAGTSGSLSLVQGNTIDGTTPTHGLIRIFNPKGQLKNVHSTLGTPNATNAYNHTCIGVYKSTNELTKITVFVDNNYAVGTTFILRGIRG